MEAHLHCRGRTSLSSPSNPTCRCAVEAAQVHCGAVSTLLCPCVSSLGTEMQVGHQTLGRGWDRNSCLGRSALTPRPSFLHPQSLLYYVSLSCGVRESCPTDTSVSSSLELALISVRVRSRSCGKTL